MPTLEEIATLVDERDLRGFLLALEEVAFVAAAALLGVIVFWSAIHLIFVTKHSATFLVNTLSKRSNTEAPVALALLVVPIPIALAVLAILVLAVLVLAVLVLAVLGVLVILALALVTLVLLGAAAEEGISSKDGTTEYGGLWVR